MFRLVLKVGRGPSDLILGKVEEEEENDDE
jgi:hypothetical protein